MTQEKRAKKDKCTLVVSVDGGKLRILGASDDPLIILTGRICELRESGGQVHVIQRDAGPWENQTPSPPDPHEDSDTDYATPAPAEDPRDSTTRFSRPSLRQSPTEKLRIAGAGGAKILVPRRGHGLQGWIN